MSLKNNLQSGTRVKDLIVYFGGVFLLGFIFGSFGVRHFIQKSMKTEYYRKSELEQEAGGDAWKNYLMKKSITSKKPVTKKPIAKKAPVAKKGAPPAKPVTKSGTEKSPPAKPEPKKEEKPPTPE